MSRPNFEGMERVPKSDGDQTRGVKDRYMDRDSVYEDDPDRKRYRKTEPLEHSHDVKGFGPWISY